MRILVVASGNPQFTAAHRTAAMRRLGHEVTALDTDPLLAGGSRIANWLCIRTMVGRTVATINRAVLDAAAERRFDLIWFDKPVWIRPATVRALRATGAMVISLMPDNPFGPRGDPGWRLFRAALPEYSAHVLANPASTPQYYDSGAKRVMLMPFGFEPTVHYPPPDGWDDSRRDVDVCFVGSPYDDRAGFLRTLWRDHGIAARIWGEPRPWRRAFDPESMAALHAGSAVYADAYREVIWRSRICLGFVTHSNLDSFAHRWFEITGAGGFLLAERTEDGLRSFADGREAVFFDGVAECAAQIRRYLPDQPARAAIARAGHARAVASGYDNDTRLRRVFDELFTSDLSAGHG